MYRLAGPFVAAAVALTPLPAVASGVTPDCSMMTATPAGSPLVVWCATTVQSSVTGRTEDVRLWRSTGNGRWVETKAANVVVAAAPSPPQVSPRWASDRTLYWATSAGMYASTDLGETFTLVSPLVTGSDHPARRVLLTDTDGTVRASVAGHDPHDIGYTTMSGVTGVALGSADDDVLFVPAPDGIGVLAWDAVTAGAHRVTAYACTAVLVCAAPWFSLPPPVDGWAHQVVGGWRRPGAPTDEPTYVAYRAGPNHARVSVVRVTANATALPAADLAVSSVADGRNAPTVTFTFDGGRVLMRVISWADRQESAHDRIYASIDRGTSWQRVVAAVTNRDGRTTGTSGWRPGAVSLSFVPFLSARGDVWLANVSDGSRYTLRCSRDRGRRWRSSCL